MNKHVYHHFSRNMYPLLLFVQNIFTCYCKYNVMSNYCALFITMNTVCSFSSKVVVCLLHVLFVIVPLFLFNDLMRFCNIDLIIRKYLFNT